MVGAVQVLFRLLLATVLGGAVGLERERQEKAAGFKTHILVCVGSCLIMLTSMHIFDVYKGSTVLDPARILRKDLPGRQTGKSADIES